MAFQFCCLSSYRPFYRTPFTTSYMPLSLSLSLARQGKVMSKRCSPLGPLLPFLEIWGKVCLSCFPVPVARGRRVGGKPRRACFRESCIWICNLIFAFFCCREQGRGFLFIRLLHLVKECLPEGGGVGIIGKKGCVTPPKYRDHWFLFIAHRCDMDPVRQTVFEKGRPFGWAQFTFPEQVRLYGGMLFCGAALLWG